MAIALKSLSQRQLTQLIKIAQRRKEELAKERVAKLQARIQAVLKAEGLTLADVLGAEKKRKRA